MRFGKIALAAAVAATFGIAAVSGCGAETREYTGDYHYVQYGTTYGVKVNVVVQSDSKGDRIRKVTVADSEYVEASPADGDYPYVDNPKWFENRQAVLNEYRGKYVADVLAANVALQASGAPQPIKNGDDANPYFSNFGEGYIVTGATQCSGRLMLAVQDALKKTEGYSVAEGEYHYANPWGGADYGIKVRVVVKDGVIQKVAEIPCDYVPVTASWDNKNVWLDGLDALLAAYEGKTVQDINALSVTCNEKGEPTAVDNAAYVITGSTMGSGRLVLAVQNALANLG